MAYVQQSWRDRPGAVAAVIVVHAAVGWALVTGLGYSKIIEVVQNPRGIFVPEVPLPPPPTPTPSPEVVPSQKAADPPLVAPLPKLDIGPERPPIEATPNIPDVIVPLPRLTPAPIPQPSVAPRPAFDPVGVLPRGNPANWVTINDYRTSWIAREMTGTARFRLQVGVNGRVESCTITASSGYAELDKATCALVTSRARFDPAKDANGAAVAGSYANAVRWQLPE